MLVKMIGTWEMVGERVEADLRDRGLDRCCRCGAPRGGDCDDQRRRMPDIIRLQYNSICIYQ
jgi:hypothetical protein